ncbi:hypothetical protein GGH92_010136, partial [Coemansia sp. RSA 2673]
MQAWQCLGFASSILLSLAALGLASQAEAQPHRVKRVVGGSAAQDGEYPFAVFVSSPTVTNNTGCAGAILTDQIIVTAAYCIYDSQLGKAVAPSAVAVGYGRADKSQQPLVKVEKIIFPSTYNATSGVDDIALLQVNL